MFCAKNTYTHTHSQITLLACDELRLFHTRGHQNFDFVINENAVECDVNSRKKKK